MGKVKGQHSSAGISLEQMLEDMDRAGIGQAFLVAAKAGRVGLPGCYHMPPEVVADAVAQYPERFFGLLGMDPFQGMDGVRAAGRCGHQHGLYRCPPVPALVRPGAQRRQATTRFMPSASNWMCRCRCR